MKSHYLVCYDITEPKRWARVYRFLRERGVHLQYSVFRCELTWPELQATKERLAELIHSGEDDVRIYPLPSGQPVREFGRGGEVPVDVDLFVD